MSAAVTTTTFDQSNAGSRSIASSLARGSVDRMVAPYQGLEDQLPSVYFASPVSFPGPSRRSGSGGRTRPGTTASAGTSSGAGAAVRGGAVRTVTRLAS